MSAAYWLPNLGAYALQALLLIAVGLLLPRWVNLGRPETRLRYWQGMLALTLLLPLMQPWRSVAGNANASTEIGFRYEIVGLAHQTGVGIENFLYLSLALAASIALARLAWLALGLRTLARYRREAIALSSFSGEILQIHEHFAVDAEILVSQHVSIPLTYGWKEPTILVPRSFLRLSPEAQKGILCHELLHVRRRDWPVTVGEEILKSLLWFHPGVWLFLARIRLSREQIVDLEVLRLTREKRAYLEALCSLASTRSTAVVGLALLRRSQLLHRVRLMTLEVPGSLSRPIATTLLLVALLASTMALSATLFPLVRPQESREPTRDTRALSVAPEAPEALAKVRREPIFLDDRIIPPRLLAKVSPDYPELARKARTEGVVVLQMVIDVDGSIREGKVLRSARSDLDSAALQAARQWRFEPATLDGKPVPVYYNLTINFRLS